MHWSDVYTCNTEQDRSAEALLQRQCLIIKLVELHADVCDVEGVGPGLMKDIDCIERGRARARVLHQSASTPRIRELLRDAQACEADDDVDYDIAEAMPTD